MSDLDDKILRALDDEDRDLLNEFGQEAGLFEIISDSFRGRFRHWVILVWSFSLLMTGAWIYCAVRFFSATTTDEKLMWVAGFLVSCLMVVTLKMWYWMEMNRTLIVKDIKRVELQLALLQQKLRS